MIPDSPSPWEQSGARAATNADNPRLFMNQQVLPLFFRETKAPSAALPDKQLVSEAQFWERSHEVAFGIVSLPGFTITDWFPRAPGVYWSRHAKEAREQVWSTEPECDPQLGKYYSPRSKLGLIEVGGIGTIRLRPRRIDGVDCWLATALTGVNCHTGIPLAIPHALLGASGVQWGDKANVTGRVRFLQDAGLEDIASSVHGARPLIVFVESLVGVERLQLGDRKIIISPVALFETDANYDRANYTFVQCAAGSDAELDKAADWVEAYTTKHSGHIITNFDEQRPAFADAPLSYQRLISKTYNRAIIQRFTGTMVVQRIDSLTSQHFGDTHVGHNINVSGPAIIAIDSTLSNVSQMIGVAQGLDPNQKLQLETLVQTLKSELDSLKSNHPDEAKEIADALQKAVATASKPPEERKKNFLQLSAKGLTEAAELVKDIAPTVLATAGMIARFVVGL
jgi:hypothetical protein